LIVANDAGADSPMYHAIQFTAGVDAHIETCPKRPPEQVHIGKGTRLRARVKPHVVETPDGPVELADLFLEDGTATRLVPFACFSFLDSGAFHGPRPSGLR
jgi:hypothetical protein